MVRIVVLLGLVACSRNEIDRDRSATLFDAVDLATAPGLSGLAADEQGQLWAIAERAERVYRIALDARLHPTLETFTVTGVPNRIDLEAMEVLGDARFVFGTESRETDSATVLLAERRGTTIAITQTLTLSAAEIGITMANNHGAEGVCGMGSTILVAIEGAGVDAGKRWAPVIRIENGAVVRRHRVWLSSETGKISGLDCAIGADGTITAWAIERHFEVVKILAFTLPATDADITPRVALDLGPILNNRLNLEGIVQLPDGRIVTVSDNQWKTIQGPSKLLVFRPDAVK